MDQKVKPQPLSALQAVSEDIAIRSRYDNFIGGKWVAPVKDAAA